MTHILITGANGQVGSELQFLAEKYPNWQFTFTDYQDLDITKASEVNAFFAQHNFDYCINCAAYTAVDRAESEVEKATAINVTGVQHLATACEQHQVQLLHLSTDYVYHNDCNRPLVETDFTNPQSIYAITKLDGEKAAQQIFSSTCIIRTSWVYSSFGGNFVKTMLRLGRERDKLTVIFDQIGTPTYARSLAAAMLAMIEKVETKNVNVEALSGIFHYSNEGVCSWYDFAQAIFDLENINVQLAPIETKDYPTAAARPLFSVLNKAKIKSTFELTIPHWRTDLEACLEAMERGNSK